MTPVRIPNHLYEQIKILADKEKRTIQAQLELLVEKGLKR